MLIWNAIVRDESKIIERCVNSLLPHVDGAVIVDTGSTDGTPDLLAEMFGKVALPLELYHASFENFSQARNVALAKARESWQLWDYLLLADADMELKVEQPDWLMAKEGLSYDLKQIAGSLGYYNRRLVHRRATGCYVGPTHEYLDVESAGTIAGAHFIDHADGFNRTEKFRRDIALLEKALETETRPGLIQRYHFYLAGSYYDSGDWTKAAEHYKLRTTLGGFDEEVWYAQLRYAHCLENLGDKSGFVWEMLRAYEMRQSRMESLYDLAKYFRERGDNHVSLLFSEPGLQVRAPKDLLFINNFVYNTGLKEEFAISAYYSPLRRDHGTKVCNELALGGSEQARSNLYWYLQPLVKFVPSFMAHNIDFTPPEGWVPMNPSVINHNGKPLVLVRTVNYTITPEGVYAIRGQDGSCSRSNPINTRNYLVGLDYELEVESASELLPPADWPQPKFDLVLGFEDSRLFKYNGQPWTISCVRDLSEQGWCTQILAPVTTDGYGSWREIMPRVKRRHEKNWMPWVRREDTQGGALQFVYRLGTVIDDEGRLVSRNEPKFKVDHISGGSQVLRINGMNLALVHEARSIPGRPDNRYYQHRFVLLGNNGELRRISPPFFFHDRQIEFAAGMAYFRDKNQLVISYGVRDCEAWLATMDINEVRSFITEWQQ